MCVVGTCGSQKRALASLELELQVVVSYLKCVLGMECTVLWKIDHNEPGQMGGENELHHQIVQCLKNVGFEIVPFFVLPIIRGLSSSLGQGSQVLVFLAELSQCPTVELPARWAVTAAESEKLCKRKKRFFQFSRRKSLRE